MKQLFILLLVLVLSAACSTQKETTATTANKTASDTEVSAGEEYDVETYDKRFEVWYKTKQTPANYKTQAYYESWNRQYVTAWNAKCQRMGKDWRFDPVEGYEPNEDYGFEMNHKLFYYFMYVENILKISILPGGPTDY